MGRSTELGMFICSSKTRIILVGTCGRHQNGWKEAKSRSYVEEMDEAGWSWRTNFISWPRVRGMHSTWMRIERTHSWGIQKDVRVTNFCRSNWDIAWVGETSRKNSRVVVWSGRWCAKRKEMYHNFKKEERLENCPRCAHILSWIFCFQHDLVDLTFFGHKMDKSLWQTLCSFGCLHSSHKWSAIWSCGKHDPALSTGFMKANVNVSQFHRIWSYFFTCRFAHGWYSPWSLGFGDSVAFFSQYTNIGNSIARRSQPPKRREIECAMKPKAPTPKWRDMVTETMMRFQMRITSPQTQNLLTSKLSCTFLMTMKLWSKDQQIERKYYLWKQKNVRSTNLRQRNWKSYLVGTNRMRKRSLGLMTATAQGLYTMHVLTTTTSGNPKNDAGE